MAKTDSSRAGVHLGRRHFLQGVGGGVAATAAIAHIQPSGPLAAHVIEEIPGRTQKLKSCRLKVNGRVYRLEVEPRWTLLNVLRRELNLTGTKLVCDRAECGACTVLADGKPVYSCMLLALDAQGKEIETIEGLAAGDKLHPVQEAFLRNDAFQCGFCTPGMIMACKGLLDHNQNPSLDDIRRAVSGNLCKCGAYTKIFRAASEAGATLRGGR